jgi:hypothetical protein
MTSEFICSIVKSFFTTGISPRLEGGTYFPTISGVSVGDFINSEPLTGFKTITLGAKDIVNDTCLSVDNKLNFMLTRT